MMHNQCNTIQLHDSVYILWFKVILLFSCQENELIYCLFIDSFGFTIQR